MKLSFFSARLVLVLALVLVGACEDGGTGIDTRVGGQYNLVSALVTSLDDGQSERQAAPLLLYDGPATDGTSQFDIRFELIESSVTLEESGSRYSFTGRYRLTETRNRFPVTTETFTASGSYALRGSTLTLAPSNASEVDLNPDATLYNGKLSIEVADPIFGLQSLYEYQR